MDAERVFNTDIEDRDRPENQNNNQPVKAVVFYWEEALFRSQEKIKNIDTDDLSYKDEMIFLFNMLRRLDIKIIIITGSIRLGATSSISNWLKKYDLYDIENIIISGYSGFDKHAHLGRQVGLTSLQKNQICLVTHNPREKASIQSLDDVIGLIEVDDKQPKQDISSDTHAIKTFYEEAGEAGYLCVPVANINNGDEKITMHFQRVLDVCLHRFLDSVILEYCSNPALPSRSLFCMWGQVDSKEESRKGEVWRKLICAETNTDFSRLFITQKLFASEASQHLVQFICNKMRFARPGEIAELLGQSINAWVAAAYEHKLADVLDKAKNKLHQIENKITNAVNDSSDKRIDEIPEKLSRVINRVDDSIKMVVFGFRDVLVAQQHIDAAQVNESAWDNTIKPILAQLNEFGIEIVVLCDQTPEELMMPYFTNKQIKIDCCQKTEDKLDSIRRAMRSHLYESYNICVVDQEGVCNQMRGEGLQCQMIPVNTVKATCTQNPVHLYHVLETCVLNDMVMNAISKYQRLRRTQTCLTKLGDERAGIYSRLLSSPDNTFFSRWVVMKALLRENQGNILQQNVIKAMNLEENADARAWVEEKISTWLRYMDSEQAASELDKLVNKIVLRANFKLTITEEKISEYLKKISRQGGLGGAAVRDLQIEDDAGHDADDGETERMLRDTSGEYQRI